MTTSLSFAKIYSLSAVMRNAISDWLWTKISLKISSPSSSKISPEISVSVSVFSKIAFTIISPSSAVEYKSTFITPSKVWSWIPSISLCISALGSSFPGPCTFKVISKKSLLTMFSFSSNKVIVIGGSESHPVRMIGDCAFICIEIASIGSTKISWSITGMFGPVILACIFVSPAFVVDLIWVNATPAFTRTVSRKISISPSLPDSA